MTETPPAQHKLSGTAVSNVSEDLASRIVGAMTPGTSLASEADMAVHYGVSRVTIREAIKMLAGRGLVEVSRGRRAVVCEPSSKALGEFLNWIVRHDPKGMFDLVDVRLSLEIQSVALAARHANRAALAAIENAMDGMRQAVEEFEAAKDPAAAETRIHHYDVGFHEAIALTGGNRVLTSLIEAISLPLEKSFYMSFRGNVLRGLTIRNSLDAHQLIFECIKKRDVRGATNAMRHHLEEAGRDMRTAFDVPRSS